MKRVLLMFVVAAIAAALAVAPATADPINNPQAISVPFTCGGEQVTLTIRPLHAASAHVRDDSRVFLAKSGTLELTDLETGETEVFRFTTKARGFEGDLVTCTATYEFGGFLWDVTVNALIAPRGK
jgi:hypothetical protein